MIKNILIPTDGSDFGKTAIAYGTYIAKKLNAGLDLLPEGEMGLSRRKLRLVGGKLSVGRVERSLSGCDSGLIGSDGIG